MDKNERKYFTSNWIPKKFFKNFFNTNNSIVSVWESTFFPIKLYEKTIEKWRRKCFLLDQLHFYLRSQTFIAIFQPWLGRNKAGKFSKRSWDKKSFNFRNTFPKSIRWKLDSNFLENDSRVFSQRRISFLRFTIHFYKNSSIEETFGMRNKINEIYSTRNFLVAG